MDYLDFNNFDYAIEEYSHYVLAGGWSTVPYRGLLKYGMISPQIELVKERLYITGEFNGLIDETFDDDLLIAVNVFQFNNGLTVDGVIGPNTTQALNISASTKLMRLKESRDVWEDTKSNYGKQYIINIPSYEAYGIEDGQLVLKSKTIVGRKSRPTAIFNDNVEYITFSPTWKPSWNIIINDLLPKFQEDPNYVDEKGYQLYFKGELIDHSDLDWKKYSPKYFPFTIIQQPGEFNAMGEVKIMFPNEHYIYMHDTPDRFLFDTHERNYSSGCIRLELPVEFTHFALEDKGWTLEQVRENMSNGETLTVNTTNIPINIIYMLSWVDENGTIRFAKDIYGYGRSIHTKDLDEML